MYKVYQISSYLVTPKITLFQNRLPNIFSNSRIMLFRLEVIRGDSLLNTRTKVCTNLKIEIDAYVILVAYEANSFFSNIKCMPRLFYLTLFFSTSTSSSIVLSSFSILSPKPGVSIIVNCCPIFSRDEIKRT